MTRPPGHFELTTQAWRQAARAWDLPPSAWRLWQTYGPGAVHAAMAGMQSALMGERRAMAPTRACIFILGFWRSGTSLLHELLCADPRFGVPTTWACFKPQHFLLSHRRAMAHSRWGGQRPQDRMMLNAASPQEDEFGLLLGGARSPYESLLAPRHFSAAMALADPDDLSPQDAQHWQHVFLDFLKGLSLVNDGRPMVLKSPTHSYRVPTLRRLLPDARFIVIVRNPYEVLESTVRTYRALTDRFGIGPGLSDGELRQLLLNERLRLEQKLQRGIVGVPDNRLAFIRYEDLVCDPLTQLERLYARLDLPDFDAVRGTIAAAVAAKSGYEAAAVLPDELWTRRIADRWADIFDTYGYHRQTGAVLPDPAGRLNAAFC